MTSLLATLLAAAPFTTFEPPGTETAAAPGLCRTAATLCMTWIEHPGDTYRLRFARLEKGRWTPAVTITESQKLVSNWADTPSVVRGGDGALIAHWAERSGEQHHAYDVVLARSTDDGKTWRRVGIANDDGTATEHGFVSLFTEPKGTSLVWLDGRQTVDGGSTTLRTGSIATAAVASQAVLDSRVCDCCGTSSAVGADGPVIVYRDRSGDEVRDISVMRRVGAKWTEPRPVNGDGWSIPGCPVNGPSIAARGKALAVAWYTYANGQPRVRVAFSKDSGATFGRAIEVDAARGSSVPIGRVGVVLDDDGTALVSWVATKREEAEVFVRRASSDGRLGEAVSAGTSTSARQSGFPRIARDERDLVLAWTHGQKMLLWRAAMQAFPKPVAVLPEGTAAPATAPKEAPAIEVSTLDGKPVSLKGLAGRPVLLNFWATWCEPCRMELPELAALDARHRDQGLLVVGISVDHQAGAKDVKAFADRMKVVFPLWLDPDERLASAFGVQNLPASFLIDRSGKVVWSKAGAIAPNDSSLAAAISAVLAH